MPGLVCVECGLGPIGQACGWRAYLVDLDDDGQDEVALYCPACVEREFGGRVGNDFESPAS